MEDVELEIKLMQRTMAKLEADVKENYGLLKQLSGRQEAMDRLEEVNRVNLQQERAIGSLEKGMIEIAKAMQSADDKGLSEAAKGITVNIDAKTNIDGDVSGDVAGGDLKK